MSVQTQSVFDYNPAIPDVIPQIQRRFFAYPTGTYQQFVNQSDIIRFQFPKTKDFFDPWSLYINATVNCTPAAGTVMQGAGSFNHIFSSVVFYDPTGRELERINGYNRLMEVLETVSYDARQMGNMAWQGFGGTVDTSWGYQCGAQPVTNTPYHKFLAQAGTTPFAVTAGDNVRNAHYNGAIGDAFLPWLPDTSAYGSYVSGITDPYTLTPNAVWIGPYHSTGSYPWQTVLGVANASTQSPPYVATAFTPVDWTLTYNWTTGGTTPPGLFASTPQRLSYWHPLKSNAFNWGLPTYMTHDSSASTGPTGMGGQGWSTAGTPSATAPQGGVSAPIAMADAFWGTGFQPISPIVSNQVVTADWSSVYNNANTTAALYLGAPTAPVDYTQLQSQPMIYGLAKPFNDNFCGSAMEPTFSTSVLTHYINRGLPTATNYTSQAFKIPIMLGLIGHFIRKENYRLIPMEIFEGCTLEFTMNPTYLFTSNHTMNQQNRNF
jgi:hypothetical protein